MVVGVSMLLKSSAEQTHEQDKAQHWGAGDPGPTGDTLPQMESSVFIELKMETFLKTTSHEV